MTKIKICGLKSKQDIEMVNELLPEYVGFVFAKSRREVTKEKVAEFIINSKIKKVGVFVNENINTICDIVRVCNLDVIQLHGDETPQYIDELKEKIDCEIWKAIRVKDKQSLDNIIEYNVDLFLFDTYCDNEFGGSGISFDFEILNDVEQDYVLAGGMNSNNVETAISTLHPYIIDVSSGVETNGIKDKVKIEEFIKKVRMI